MPWKRTGMNTAAEATTPASRPGLFWNGLASNPLSAYCVSRMPRPRLKLIDWVYLVLALVGTAWVVITFLNDR
jgi:hypothetical protein